MFIVVAGICINVDNLVSITKSILPRNEGGQYYTIFFHVIVPYPSSGSAPVVCFTDVAARDKVFEELIEYLDAEVFDFEEKSED